MNFHGTTATVSKSFPTQYALNHIHAHWSPQMTTTEFSVVLFIFQRTYRFNKLSEYIPVRHFLNGITARNGRVIAPPVHIKRRMLLYVLNRLEKAGFITVKRRGGKDNEYSLNLDFQQDLQTFAADAEIADCGEENQQVSLDVENARGCNGLHFNNNTPTEYYSSNSKITDLDSNESKARRTQNPIQTVDNNVIYVDVWGMENDGVRSRLMAVEKAQREKTALARKKKILKGGTSAYHEIWADEWKKVFPAVPVPPWKNYIGTQFSRMFRNMRNDENFSPEDFLRLCVREWEYIIKKRFYKYKNAPEYPSPGFVIKFVDRFFDAYFSETEHEAKLESQTSRFDIAKNPNFVRKDELEYEKNKLRDEMYGEKVKVLTKAQKAEREAEKLKKRVAYLEAENRRLENLPKVKRAKALTKRDFMDALKWED